MAYSVYNCLSGELPDQGHLLSFEINEKQISLIMLFHRMLIMILVYLMVKSYIRKKFQGS